MNSIDLQKYEINNKISALTKLNLNDLELESIIDFIDTVSKNHLKAIIPKKINKASNPKSHDSLFKWLISSFLSDFFSHYFPNVNIKIGKNPFIDKEFISKYEALKASLEGDLFLALEVEIDAQLHDVVIHIELERKKTDMKKRVFEYLCYTWLMKKLPVWSIVMYTDDAIWRKDVPDSYFYGYNSKGQKQLHHFDVIKVKKEKSSDLINKQSLLCNLLALKANDKGLSREYLVKKIFQKTAEMKDTLTNDQRLLIVQFVDFYKKIPDKIYNEIKKEVDMGFVATTITEHIQHISEMKGERRGERKGKLEGKLEALKEMFQEKVISKRKYEQKASPLRQQLEQLMGASQMQLSAA